MKLQSSILRKSLFVFGVALALPMLRLAAQTSGPSTQAPPDSAAAATTAAQSAAVPSRITQAIDEKQLVTLKGNVHPLARPEFDQGAAPDSTTIKRGVILLQRSADQEAALRKLLDDQQSKNSPNFHKWLTPDQFGTQFAPSDSDVQTVTDWLTQRGFHDVKVGQGKLTVEFSGNVAQVRSAFHTDIHQFLVNGEPHLANVSEAQVPAALAPVVAGVYGLHNFRPKSLVHRAENFKKERASVVGKAPAVTFSSGCGAPNFTSPCYAVAPADFAKIYNVPATVGANPSGQGVTIAIVQDSNLNISDVQQFRSIFGLSNNFNASNIILNGPDPGVQDPTTISGDETEADLDVEWAGAVAPAATIKLVVSEDSQTLGAPGIDLSAIYIIDNNLAPIMSESFGTCETATNGVEPFYSALWEQAAAQGITVVVSTGDSGSDVCDASTGFDFATTGISVSGIASTPFNVALGGTDFQNGTAPSVFWSVTNGAGGESAKSYIPESTWNSSCAASATSGTVNTTCPAAIINTNTSSGFLLDIAAGSGAESSVTTNTRPSWQTGVTPTADTRRDIPDISLFSAINTNSNSFFLMCEADSQSQGGNACQLASGQTVEITPIGGTSAAAPAFAGIMALVVQSQGGQRQGNANFVLYQLYKKNLGNANKICLSNVASVSAPGCIFYDVITGNNSIACQGGTLNCSNTNTAANQYGVLVDPASITTPAFTAVAGYDKATGLGSVNVANLLASWSSASFTTDTTTITASPSAPVSHGTNASFTVKVSSAGGTPTGDISLVATPSGGQPVGIGQSQLGPPFPLSGGSVTIQTNLLPGGNDSVVAQYSGDGTFAPGQSTPVNVTVNKESSKTAISMATNTSTNATTAVYGSPYLLRVDVTNSSGQICSAAIPPVIPCPTGQVSLTDNGAPLNDFSSPSSTLPAGTTTLNELGFFEDQPVQLPGGSNALQAVYAGDTSYAGSTSATNTVMITPAGTVSTVAASPGSGVTTNTVVTLTATITTQSSGNGPTGTVTFSSGGSTLGTANVVPTAAAGLNTNAPLAAFGTATLTHTFTTANTYTVSVSYVSGDNNYSASASSGQGNASITVTQASSSGNFTVAGSAATVAAGNSGTSAITVTPSGGFTGAVAITCGTTLPGVTCNALNVTVPSGGGNGTGTLTINVTAPSTATTAMNLSAPKMFYATNRQKNEARAGWWTLSTGTGFAAVLLLFLPGRKRIRAALGLGLVCVLSFTLGCGGYGGGGGGGGTSATTTKLTISSTKVAANGSLTVSAAVTTVGSHAPTGSVTFLVDGTALGNAAPLTSGSTGNITVTAAQAPAFLQLVGTHRVTASYSGDTYNTASSSGNLSVTVTGNASLPITGTSGNTTANGTVALTIN